jgi:hypothetical protein
MKVKEICKRLEKAEHSLTPQQALLVAMDKAIARFESLSECDAWLRDHPGELLLGDIGQVLSALSKRLSKEPPDVVIKAVIHDLRQRVFLAGLWLVCNRYAADMGEQKLPWLALLAWKLEALVDRSDFICPGPDEIRMRRREHALRPAKTPRLATKGEATEVRNYRKEKTELIRALFETHFAVVTMSTRYFDNKRHEQIEGAETLAHLYNKVLDLTNPLGEGATWGGQDPQSRIDVDEIKRNAKDSSEAVVESLINGVKSDMRAGLAGAKRAREIFTASLRNP